MIKKLTITFPSASLTDNQFVTFKATIGGITKNYLFNWTDNYDPSFKFTSIETEATAPFSYDNYDAFNYQQKLKAFDIESYFHISRVGDSVVILSRIDGLDFSLYGSDNSEVIFTLETVSSLSPFNIVNVELLATSTPCSTLDVRVTTDAQASRLTSPFIQDVTENPFTFTYTRGNDIVITVENSEGQTDLEKLVIPRGLVDSNININTVSTPTTNTVTIIYSSLFLDGLSLEYSLDDVTYQTDNTFELEEGSYTAYVKDQFGCVASKDFTIVNSFVKKPYHNISKINALRYKLLEDVDAKTDENTLSCEVLDRVVHKDFHLYETKDVIPTQIKTNYSNISATLIDENENEQELLVFEKLKFLNIKDSRDCVIFKKGTGTTGIYFEEGNIYDYDTDAVIDNYQLYGKRPYWMRTGTFINLEGVGDLEIIGAVYDEEVEKEIIIVNYNYTGLPFVKKIKSIYNIRNFNVYEFDTPFLNVEDKECYVKISLTDDDLEDVTYISEAIKVTEKQKDTLRVDWWGEKNGDVFYETNIKFFGRYKFLSIKDNPISEIEIHKGDTTATVTEADYYEGDIIEFDKLSKERSKTLEMALLHSNLLINYKNYKSAEKPDKEKQADSNLYIVTGTLIKGGIDLGSISIIDVESEVFREEAPTLIGTGELKGFISY